MKTWMTALLLIQTCLLTVISGVTEPAPVDMTTPTEATTMATEPTNIVTIPTVEPTAPTTMPTIPTTAPTIPKAEPTIGATEIVTKPTVGETRPQATKPETNSGKLVSLGKFKLTAYCSCRECCGKYAVNRPKDENGKEIVIGAAGVPLKVGVSVAVDPRIIPYGSKVVINGHTYTAQDTGGSIKGKIIDVYFGSHPETEEFGVQYAEVFVYEQTN